MDWCREVLESLWSPTRRNTSCNRRDRFRYYEYQIKSPGGYFYGMVAKAKAGELNLVRTIWGLWQGKAAKERVGRSMH